MSALLTKVKEHALCITHLNNDNKANYMSKNDVGWEDILDQAKDLYKEQMVEGLERWPPASNPKDSKKPPSDFQANLTQAPCPSHRNKKSNKKSKEKGTQDDNHSNGRKGKGKTSTKNGKRSKNRKKEKNLKLIPPGKNKKRIRYVNGEPLYKKESMVANSSGVTSVIHLAGPLLTIPAPTWARSTQRKTLMCRPTTP